MKKNFFYLIFIVSIFLFTGCSAPKNSVVIPNFKQEYKAKKNIIVVPPKIKVYEISAAGEEEMKEWSQLATSNMKQSLEEILASRNLINSYNILDLDTITEEDKTHIVNTNNLMYRVATSITYHALENSFFKFDEKIKNFDYSIGDALAENSNEGDVYLFINAFDKVQSSGKVAVETAKLVIGALFGIAAGDFGGLTYSNIALVDAKTGKILWYNYYISKGQVDLREHSGTNEVVKVLLDDLQNYL